MKNLALVLAIFSGCAAGFAQNISSGKALLSRQYREGEKLAYHMKASNEDWHYEIDMTGVVKRDAAGKFVEEYAWSNPLSNGAPVPLPPGSLAFRQTLSLDPAWVMTVPDLSQVHPSLIGPITDFMGIYSDLWLAARTGKLARAGDHWYQKNDITPSWADGTRIVLGQDSIDFDLTLTRVRHSEGTATLLVRHVPPEHPRVKLPAPWMCEPVADTPNNWVNVAHEEGKYIAAVGKETFDVQIVVSLADRKILSANMHNPVKARERECEDAALEKCGPAHPHDILRKVSVSLVQ